MGKVVDTTYVQDTTYLLSQTPKNFVKDDYWLREMQEKVWADWDYIPNRVDIEEEKGFGTEEYEPLEVVIQTINAHSGTNEGTKVRDDWRRIVFKDIFSHREVGTRYRFSYKFDLNEPNENKSVWIAVNQNSATVTAAQDIVRCNGTLGSIWLDENGNRVYHYEPVVQGTSLSSTVPVYSDVAIDPKSQLAIICQHNKYTRDYYINQRFVIGYDRVYKVTNIIKTDALRTYQSEFVGVMTIYLDFDQNSALDDFEHRIAYNGREDETPTPLPDPNPDEVEGREIRVVAPKPLPTELYSYSDETPYEVWVYKDDERLDDPVSVKLFAVVDGETIDDPELVARYCELDETRMDVEHKFTLKRLAKSWSTKILVRCFSSSVASPEDGEISYEFELGLWGLE